MAMKEKNLEIIMKQGGNAIKFQYSGKHESAETIGNILATTGSYGYFGHNLRFTDSTVVAPEGGSIVMKYQKLICDRVDMGPVFISGVLPVEKADLTPIATVLKTATIGGGAIEEITRKLANETF